MSWLRYCIHVMYATTVMKPWASGAKMGVTTCS